MWHISITPLIWWMFIDVSHVLVAGMMPVYSPKHTRISLGSGLWLSAEYDKFIDTSPIDDLLPFAVYNQETILDEEEAFGVPGLVVNKEHTDSGAMSDYTAYATYENQPGFIKCSYKIDWYQREVDALLNVTKLNHPMPAVPAWHGYLDAIPSQSLFVQLLTYFRTGDGYGCIVLDLVDGITLKEYAASLTSLQKDVALRDIVRQLLISLAYLHHGGWAHCDIKPSNIMVHIIPHRIDGKPNTRVTLIDFNLALPTIDGIGSTRGHTVGYAPPEFYLSAPIDLYALDSWELGATLYKLFANSVPYEMAYNDEEKKKKMTKKERRKIMLDMLELEQHSYKPLNCSEEAREFIDLLLTINPDKRPTMKEMMWHRWLK
ncbi:kinase-like domain-containing protein [Syncephalis fuscata]|nr:kinase-like domain-containing protein [Syncephalis fuscata]